MAEYQLSINERCVTTRGVAPEATLERIVVRYAEPRELVFKYTGGDILNAEVELKVDGVVRFFGHALDRQCPNGLVGTVTTYTAYGLEEKAGGISLVNALSDFPVFQYVGATMLEVFEDLVENALGEELRDLGVEPEFVGATADMVPPLQLSGNTLGEAMHGITVGVPGFSWLIDPATRKFLITNVFDAPTHTVTLGKEVVPHRDLQIRESLRDRATAVALIGPVAVEIVQKWHTLVPAWNTSLEAGWTIDAGQTGGGDIADVFRKFSFQPIAREVLLSEMVELRQVVQTEAGTAEHSVEIADIDPAGLVWSKLPMVRPVQGNRANMPNVRLPGKAKPPTGATLVYQTARDAPNMWIRYPAGSGFSGTAYDIYGIEHVKRVYEPSNGNITSQRAIRMHKAHCDVMYEGTVPLVGEVPSDLWNLGRRINIAKRGEVTGLENAGAILREIEYNFRTNRTTLQVGGDRSLYTGEGMG